MRQAGDGIFSEKRETHGGLNTLARGVRKLQTASGQVSWLLHRRLTQRRSSQWRDRAGFSPASLFFPLDAGHPDAYLKELNFD
jgi:hypothetical protein